MKQYYIGGSLFTDKQRKQRMTEDRIISAVVEDSVVYNPMTNDDINDKTQKPTAQDIFDQDTREILKSDVILADLDDDDMGLAMELGIAYACNHIRGRLIEALANDEPVLDGVNSILSDIPKKRVYATCSDIRQDTEDEKGIYKSWSLNQYYVGGVEKIGTIHRSFDDVVKAIKEDEGQ